MKRVIPRVRSLTVASDGTGVPWSLSLLLRTFRTLPNLERLTVATIDPVSHTPHYWSAIDGICGSGRAHESLETVEFSFALPHSTSSAEYMSREGLREKLPYLAKHGILKISDPNMYVADARVCLLMY